MSLSNIYFIDIETVPDTKQNVDLFLNRFKNDTELSDGTSSFFEKAGLYAEHGKIVCVCIGKMQATKLYIKRIAATDEVSILKAVAEALKEAKMVGGHNIKDFDCPFLMRRYIINGLSVPGVLSVMNKKPWDMPMVDTMEMWGGSQWKYRVGLDLMANILGIESPKDDMSGKDVATVYYNRLDEIEENELPFDKEKAALDRIANYCAGDVKTTVQVYCRLMGLALIAEEQIVYV